jgi:hypothetical protein
MKILTAIKEAFLGKKAEKDTNEGEWISRCNAICDSMLTYGLPSRREQMRMYQDGLNYTFGNQYANRPEAIKDGWDAVISDFIFPAIQQQMAVQSQRTPAIQAKAWNPEEESDVATFDSHLKWLFTNELDVPLLRLKATLDGCVYGNYIVYTYWDNRASWDMEKEAWRGQIRQKLIRPEFFGMDPDAESADFDSPDGPLYMFHRSSVSRRDLSIRWPDSAGDIEAAATHSEKWQIQGLAYSTDFIDSMATTEVIRTLQDQGRLVSLLRRAHRQSNEGETTGHNETDRVDLEMFFFRDAEEVEISVEEKIPEDELIGTGAAYMDGVKLFHTDTQQEVNSQTHPVRLVKRKKPLYPRGRFILRVGALILNPKSEDQVWQFENAPYTVGVNKLLPHTWIGLNSVELAKHAQDMTNTSAQHIHNAVKMFGDPLVIMEEGALPPELEDASVQSVAGGVVVVAANKMDKFRREPAPQISEGLFRAHELSSQGVRSATSNHQVAEGQQAGGATATEIINLATASRLQWAMANLLLDNWTVRMMETVAEMAQRYYQPDDVIRVLGGQSSVGLFNKKMQSVKYDLLLKVGTELPLDVDREKQDAEKMLSIFGMTPTVIDRLAHAYKVEDVEAFKKEVTDYQQFQQWKAQQEAIAQQQARAATGPAAPVPIQGAVQ